MNNPDNAPINILELAAEADEFWFRDELAFAWRTAQDEAVFAYEEWLASPGRTAYVVYRAAQDRADQAQDALAAAAVEAATTSAATECGAPVCA
jgi:hypothetical protein